MSEIQDTTRNALEGKDLVVTRRPFEAILEYAHLSPDDLQKLPRKALIVEIGSGDGQEFANGVKKMREDLVTISIDPTLAISENRHDVRIYEGGNNVRYQFRPQDQLSRGDVLTFQQVQKERVEKAKLTGNVIAAFAPELPLANNSIELLVDSHAAGLYLAEDKIPQYFQEIERVITNTGQARIYPLGFVDILNPFKSKQAKTQVEKLLAGIDGLKAEYYFIDDTLGLILTKDIKSE